VLLKFIIIIHQWSTLIGVSLSCSRFTRTVFLIISSALPSHCPRRTHCQPRRTQSAAFANATPAGLPDESSCGPTAQSLSQRPVGFNVVEIGNQIVSAKCADFVERAKIRNALLDRTPCECDAGHRSGN
jgi:hypothetical protein